MSRAMEWAADSACRHVNVSGEDDPFHPDPELLATGDYWEQVGAAKELCAACPVAADCLLYALAEGGTAGKDGRWQSTWAGIWGGYTSEEREALVNSVHEVKEPECETPTETQTFVPAPREASPSPTSLLCESSATSTLLSAPPIPLSERLSTLQLSAVACKRSGKNGRRRSRRRR